MLKARGIRRLPGRSSGSSELVVVALGAFVGVVHVPNPVHEGEEEANIAEHEPQEETQDNADNQDANTPFHLPQIDLSQTRQKERKQDSDSHTLRLVQTINGWWGRGGLVCWGRSRWIGRRRRGS
jgi:hypothetical protein